MTSEVTYRSFTPDIQVRSGGDGRTVSGIAVPYGVAQRIDDTLTEQFARGAFAHQLTAGHRIPFAREHMSHGGTLIGRILDLRDDSAGLYFEARISSTPAGDETLTLLRDGALDQVSIGFRERQNRRLSDGTVERVTADLRELAVVLQGAYGDNAAVSSIRSESTTRRLDEAREFLASVPLILPL